MVYLSDICFAIEHAFRKSFVLKNKSVLNWFPGHMGKGIKQMQKTLKSVDCVIEVHDARIPFSGRNPEAFQTVCGLRPHILVYNKRDLANEKLETEILNKHKFQGFDNVIFTDCKNQKCTGLKKLIPLAQKLIHSSCRYNRSENQDSCLMVVGVPNVGKSSLINSLRNTYLLKSNAVHVGAQPGITKSVGFKVKISDDPLVYVYDTPGILTPKVSSVEHGMRLALCATIPDKEVGIELVADYLLFWLNKTGNFQYVDYLGIEREIDDVTEVLVKIAINKNMYLKLKSVEGFYELMPNTTQAAIFFVDAFRKGCFGRLTLDIDKIKLPENNSFIVKKRLNKIN